MTVRIGGEVCEEFMNKRILKKIGPLSLAKIYGVMMFVMALLIAIPYGLFIIIWSVVGGTAAGGNEGLMLGGGGAVMGILVMILMPIIYGLMGFVGGALTAFLYNIFAKFVGGVEVEVETA